ncbi:hypothetical protein [Halalkalibacter alkaliphilus]|uniref:Uncharacterized protein n=1 Tax=Halalkalibacter alkaliphilus TaxID=2917993 RepID=A0A9X2CWZ0_9BACI|nr:hypothetical protein [Halalkalibacter alkaliphilus]MCL7749895.1 hypothetical protein [Halalkalibacter alkaliphilus]
MSKRNISRCAIPVKRAKDNMIYVKVVNQNADFRRKFLINAYDKDSASKDLLPIYVGETVKDNDSLGAGEEKVYKIDVTDIKRKVVFEIVQERGGSGIGVSSKNKGPFNVEIRFK